MAEDEDSVSSKKSSKNHANSDENEPNTHKPDLGIEEAKYNSNENEDKTSPDAKSSSSKSGGATRKEENPFSFRHFLKRDLSLPGNSTYENTGARPKVYANTVQHSPNKSDLSTEPRREKSRPPEPQAKDTSRDGSVHRLSDNTTSSSSVEIPFSVADSSESKHNLYTESSEAPFYHRPNMASEPLGIPSLPDFVQDHILVEQAYLNSNGPISVDLDNLPDFTFNTNYNAGTSSWGRRSNSGYSGSRNYDYDSYAGASTSEEGTSSRAVPLDLPAGAEGPMPLDLPPHLNLDLTESVNPSDRRNNSPRNSFPLDLPPNAGAESMRLPDFLPAHPGRTSPEPEHDQLELTQVIAELQRTRSELYTERTRRSRVENELAAARLSIGVLESEAARARGEESALRARLHDARERDAAYTGQLGAAAHCVQDHLMDTAARASDAESTVAKLKNEIKKLKDELSLAQEESRSLRSVQATASRDLRQATAVAETSLRELLVGLNQLKSLSSTLDPT